MMLLLNVTTCVADEKKATHEELPIPALANSHENWSKSLFFFLSWTFQSNGVVTATVGAFLNAFILPTVS